MPGRAEELSDGVFSKPESISDPPWSASDTGITEPPSNEKKRRISAGMNVEAAEAPRAPWKNLDATYYAPLVFTCTRLQGRQNKAALPTF